MAAKVIKIEIPIETQDKTDPALGSVTAKMEDLDNAAKNAQKSMDSASKSASGFEKSLGKSMDNVSKKASGFEKSLGSVTKQKWQILLEAKDKITPTVKQAITYVKSLSSKAWRVTLKAVDLVTSPVKRVFGLLKSPLVAAGVTISAGAGIASTVKTYAEFEAAMSQVKAISGATGEEFTQLTEKAKQMGATTKFTAAQSAEAFNYMAMAGWKASDINHLSVHIPERTTTAIVGPSGGGKTTLCHLISRFWDVSNGNISLGGENVRNYSVDSLMKNFSFVFQNVYLFEDTIANNIRFGQPEASMKLVMDAAKKACCHDFIMELPNGYDTVIGEGGTSLSGGEKQRISIARAIMKDAPVIILDEATANVDPENEKELMSAIEALTKEKTIIMIAHRLKTVEHADQILVLDKGQIVQQGRHSELLKQTGIYRKFILEREEAVGWKI